MKIAVPALVGLFLSTTAASGQEDDRAQRILERIEKLLERSHARLVEDVERIVREEIRKARAAKAPEPPRKDPTEAAPAGRAYLGISPGDLTDEERKALGIGGGIRVAEVRGPAEKAGLKPGDILLEIGGEPVTEETIARALERRRPGDVVEVTVLRGRRREVLKVTLGERRD